VSGPRDFAVRTDAVRLTAPLRPSHPALNVRDDAQRPSRERGMALLMALIWVCEQCHGPAADWHDGQFAHNEHAQV